MPIRSITIAHLDEHLKRLGPALVSQPLRKFFSRATIEIQGHARQGAPVDNGLLRARIVTEVDRAEPPTFGKVGFLNAREGSAHYMQARAMEFGTGRMGDSEVSHKATHMPPGDALDVWAKRHGFESGWQVARIIARRGGLRPRRFLRNAIEQSRAAIQGFVTRLGDEILAEWKR